MKYQKFYQEFLNMDAVKDAETVDVGKNGAKAFKYEQRRGGKCDALFNIFADPLNGNHEKFVKAFKAASHGQGGEYSRINRLHSSALLALLCFWTVSEQTPFHYDGVEYTQVIFEKQNPVFSGTSSIDILLISKDGKKILFLESKFMEPLNRQRKLALKKVYKDLYANHLSKSVQVGGVSTIKVKKGTEEVDVFYISTLTGEKEYLAGIKQMVSHLIGIISSSEYNEIEEIKLGTILFDFNKVVDEFTYPAFYEEFFKENTDLLKNIANTLRQNKDDTDLQMNIANILDQNKDKADKVIVISTPLYYQEIFKGENASLLSEKVKAFYKLG